MSDAPGPESGHGQRPGRPPDAGHPLPMRADDGKAIFYATSEGTIGPADRGGYTFVGFEPAALAPQTFGTLIQLLTSIENFHVANCATAARAGEQHGEAIGLRYLAMVETNRRDWLAHLKQVSGVRDLELLGDLRQLPFSATTLRTLRAELCLNGGFGQAEADALTIPEAASRLRAFLCPPPAPVGDGTQGRFPDRDAEIVRLKKENPSRTAGQIANLIRANPAWAVQENGKPLGAGAVRAVLKRNGLAKGS